MAARLAPRTSALIGVCLFSVISAAGSSATASTALAASPGVAWELRSIAQPTNFQPSDTNDQYTIFVTNIGSLASEGMVTVTDTLPRGIKTTKSPRWGGFQCTEAPGEGERIVITCNWPLSIPGLTPAHAVFIEVTPDPGASEQPNEVTVSGGGPAECGEAERPPCPTPVSSTSPTSISPGTPLFDPFTFGASALDAAGALETRAAGHPAALTSAFDFPSSNQVDEMGTTRNKPVEDVHQIVVDLPAGLVGDPRAAPTCTLADLASNHGERESNCPPDTQVGTMALVRPALGGETGAETNLRIYNIVPEHGYPAEFGVYLPELQAAALLYASVRTGSDYGVRLTSAPAPPFVDINGVSATFFGNPALKDRSPLAPIALATTPSDCSRAGFTTVLHVDSWQHEGRSNPDGTPDFTDPNWREAKTESPPVSNCESLQFAPELEVQPQTTMADTPSGYAIDLRVPQSEDPNGLATPPLRNAVVTLPPGVSISPPAADGLTGCQPAGAEGIELEVAARGHCPLSSTIGTVKVTTPLLKDPLEGSLFVAQPTCGGEGQPACSEAAVEKGDVFGLYLEADSAAAGVYVKLRGKVEVGGAGKLNGLQPGQVRTTFTETPQQPFSELKIHINDGARAPLANPAACGPAVTQSALTPWSAATPTVLSPPPFNVDSDGSGGACPAAWPFAPGFSAGTLNPQAGAFSPFLLAITRHDREQDLSGITLKLPAGLLGKIAGVAQCGDAQANAGDCPAASRIGSVTAAAGAGAHPFRQSGAMYLTGPYRGAPFGISVVVPAKAGPYNLGNVVVRGSIGVDPHTTALTVVTDSLPQSVDGVPLRLQAINASVDREAFMSNPTSCDPTQLSAALTGTGGASVPVASRFQAAACAGLPFRPSFTATTQGRTSKANGAFLDVKIGSSGGQANIREVDTQLPLALPSRLTTLQKACTEAQFADDPAGCPAASDVGTAIAHTPLLNAPLAGPAYLVSRGGAAFPDLVIVLQGEGITLDLVGHTDIKRGITFSRFETVPDAPVSSFELTLPKGPNSLLGTTRNLCALTRSITVRRRLTVHRGHRTLHVVRRTRRLIPEALMMPTKIVGQNGARVEQSTRIAVTGCPRTKKVKHRVRATARRK